MATGTNSSASKIATVVVLIPILLGAWYAAPWVLPMWKWQNVDIDVIAKDHAHDKEGYTKARLEHEFEMVVWYNPRKNSKKDPCPYQIFSCTPPLKQVYPEAVDEDKLLVRVSLVNDHDGAGISNMWIGVTPAERFFKIVGQRLPPGSLPGKPPGRQIVLYKGMSLSKVDLNLAVPLAMETKQLENDDMWEERFDGFEE